MEKILDIIEGISYEKGLPIESVAEVVKESVIKVAKQTLDPNISYDAEIDKKNKTLHLYQVISVCADDDNAKEDKGYILIQGNTDKLIAEYNEELFEAMSAKYPVMANALKNDVELLNWRQKDFLRSLPGQLNLEFDGVKLLLVHGSPRKNNEDILPDTSLDKLEEMIKDTEADIILCGHTHIPCGFQTLSKKTVLNAGSVGRPFTENPQACYLTLNISDGKFLVEHHFVEYDNKKAAEIMRSRTFEGADTIADILIAPNKRHV